MALSAELGSVLEAYVTDLVRSGRYHSKSEVLREGVRLLQERESRLEALDAAIGKGLADAEGGRALNAEAVFDTLRRRHAGA